MTLNAFRSEVFLIKEKQEKGRSSMLALHPLDLAWVAHIACIAKVSGRKVFDHTQLKILTPKQMLQRLPISLAQVKAGNTSENLLNEIKQVIYSLYQAKKVTKKVQNNIINSIKL